MQSRDGYTSSRNIQKGHPKEMKSQYPQIYNKMLKQKYRHIQHSFENLVCYTSASLSRSHLRVSPQIIR